MIEQLDNGSARLAGRQDKRPATLRGPWLVLARTVWAAVALLFVADALAGIPSFYRALQTVCVVDPCLDWRQLSPAQARALESLGFSVPSFAAFYLALNIVLALSFFGVAVLIAWRRSDEWIVLLIAFVLVVIGASQLVSALAQIVPAAGPIITRLGNIGWSSMVAVICLFPDGRFVPRYTRVLVPAWYVVALSSSFFPTSPLSPDQWPPLLAALVGLGGIAGAIGAQIYRYLRIYDRPQRQQAKWVVFGMVTTIGGALATLGLTLLLPLLQVTASPPELYDLIPNTIIPLLMLAIPVSFGIAILRFRLYDIDVIVNRTLVYGSLTGALALVYFGGVVLLQQIFRPIIGAGNDLAVVASTLAIAALFQPFRRHIQTFIDRRFYRRKYDAARALQAFSARLRDEIDLDRMSAELLRVVDETVQPAHASLWLRDPSGTPR